MIRFDDEAPRTHVDARPARAAPWRAQLGLRFERGESSTVLREQTHFGPLVVQRPFYPEGEVCHAYVLHPPGGIVAGDELALSISVGPQAHALVTTPAAGKMYRSQGDTAQVRQDFDVRAGTLEWLPQETILYRAAQVRLRSRVRLEADARLISWEIGCFGLTARSEPFDAGFLAQSLELWRDGELALFEPQYIDAETIHGAWGMRQCPAAGTMIATPANENALEAARACLAEGQLVACTLVDRILVCRGVDPRGDALRSTFARIWSKIRPIVVGREAIAPRIWAT